MTNSPDEFLALAGATVADDLPEPEPGTLYGADALAPGEAVHWAATWADLESARAVGCGQNVLLIDSDRGDTFGPLGDDANKRLIAPLRKIVIVGGNAAFTEELARRLGRHRVWRCAWPAGCAGADATMQRHGAAMLRSVIEAAEPYPIEGIYRTSVATMLTYRHSPPPAVLTTGAESTDAASMRLPSEGKLVIVTGTPGDGKTSWVRHLMGHTASMHSRRWAVFSPEMGEWQDFAAHVIGWLANSPFRSLDDKTVAYWSEWCESRMAFISCDAEERAPTLDWYLEKVHDCVMRHGSTDALLDPWNQLSHRRAGLETVDYIDSSLQRISAFGRRHGCNMWIIAHPTKMLPLKRGDAMPVPTAYDINGGAPWYNKADLIFTVYRTEDKTQIHQQKSKFLRWGKRGRVAMLDYDELTGRFHAPMTQSDFVEPPPNEGENY